MKLCSIVSPYGTYVSERFREKIDLQITGEDTEVDKIVIDEIGDPLVHLIRNAIDRGIETVEKRRDAGKMRQVRLN